MLVVVSFPDVVVVVVLVVVVLVVPVLSSASVSPPLPQAAATRDKAATRVTTHGERRWQDRIGSDG